MAAKSSIQEKKNYRTEHLNKAGVTYEEVIESIDCLKSINSIRSRFAPYLDRDDLSSLIDAAIMDACRKYNPSFETKFTTFLIQQVSFKLRSFFHKSKQKYLKKKMYIKHLAHSYNEIDIPNINYNDVMNSVSDTDRKFLEDRFIMNLSTKEMSQKYQISEDDIHRNLKKIINSIRLESGVSLNRTKDKLLRK